VCLVYSVILTRGIKGVDEDKDIADMTLINEHGYASQELVNTMVTGKAASNCHDGDKDIGDDFIIKGIDR
jgi:ubiquitin carboxyl-terminal hydrolase MINDY-3/4